MKLVNIRDSKSRAARHEGSSPSPGTDLKNLAFIIGAAIGDGNLSNPNGRAVRLRITCDKTYPEVIIHIQQAIKNLFPKKPVAIVKRKDGAVDISCYSNTWEQLLGWKAKGGSKFIQSVHVPMWIMRDKTYTRACLRGLLLTDGSHYVDRGYTMVNFTTIIKHLAEDVLCMIERLGFSPRIYAIQNKNQQRKTKYVIRVARNANKLRALCNFSKK